MSSTPFSLLQTLRQKQVKLDNLFLDPNNPRLYGIPGYRSAEVPEERITEDDVQKDVYETMLRTPHFDVKSMYDSIKEVGFLPIDQIIVKRIGTSDNYVVLEGNRRLSAIRWILFDHKRGEITLSEDKVESMTELSTIEYSGPSERHNVDRIILQGSRHISGVKEWGPLEKAMGIMELLNTGRSATEVGSILSISAIEVNRFKRGYQALEQWKEDEEYGEHAKPNMFTIIQEVTIRPYLRDTWLNWNERAGQFENLENLRQLYKWISPSPELDGSRQLSDVRYLRNLHEVIQDSDAYQAFLEPNTEFLQAYAIVLNKKKEVQIDHSKILTQFISILEKLPIDIMMDPIELGKMERIQELLTTRISQSRRLIHG